MVLTDDGELIDIMKSLHVHGSGADKYDNVRVGLNSRLDTIQAAVLLAKMQVFEDELEMRGRVAARYVDRLKNHVRRVPVIDNHIRNTWAQFTIEVENPDELQAKLRSSGIPSARYYPRPIHRQTAYESYPVEGGHLLNTEDAMTKVIALPMYPDLDVATQDIIIEAVIAGV